ncbi:MAG: dipeptidase [Myxococcaceae bacterium]
MACLADAHADSLMWNRDLTVRSEEGHVDFPRLEEAGVKLQCFTLVTRGLPVIGGFPLFAAWRRWPRHARGGEWARATWQIDHLAELCRRSQGRASLTRTAAELTSNLAAGRLSAVLGVEGAHALEGRVERVRELHGRGVRFMGLTHLSNNELGGTSVPLHGDRPLSAHGREVLDEMAALRMPVDVSHASPRTLADLLAHPTARPFCSHSGVAAVTPVWRNLSDAALREIADKGGVVGVIFAPQFLGGRELSHLVRHLEHAVNVMGEDAVGYGSDFDGMVPLPRGMRDVRDLPLISAALRERGHSEARVEKIGGENWRRFFGEVLGS